ncbi:MAG: hypothetical protein KDD38_03780 [Bdellovibrionales bacterium]|nr:hypothetical protein [Bdellovibrionales bacterium]
MDQDGKDAVFYQLAVKYNWLETKKEKMSFLVEIEQIVLPRLSIEKMHRKSLIRRLRKAIMKDMVKCKPGRRPKYNDFDKHHLVQIWQLSGYPCSKRLKSILNEWLDVYECADSIKAHLRTMSPAQMDAYLRSPRIEYLRKVNSGTIPAKNHIKKLIRLRDPSVRYDEPGFTESDTVLHCGHYTWGTYGHTVSITDLCSGWTAGGGIYGKNAELVVKMLKTLEQRLPFLMRALFFDNGIEFVNHLLVQEFKNTKGIDVARGRSGKSNDQCHIEQKNNTFVRSIFGHVRIENPDLIPMMNEIYEIWEQLHNYFMPQMKIISKDRVGSKVRKKYDKPKTPYQRIIECEKVSEEVKDRLRKTKATLNPFKLQAQLQEKLAYFHKLNDEYNERIKQETS